MATAVGDSTIGQDVVVGDKTLVKTAGATMGQTADSEVTALGQTAAFKEKLEECAGTQTNGQASAVCGVDIELSSFYVDTDTDKIYTESTEYAKETITEFPQGNTMDFTVKVPEQYYASQASYAIAREHTGGDGSTELEVLKTEQNGNMLTFSSDKFSTS